MTTDFDSANSASDALRQKLTRYIADWIPKKRAATKAWSFAYHASLYISVILGFVAAAVLQLSSLPLTEARRNDLATVLTVLASIVAGIAAAGAFGRKWRANRISKSKLELLEIDLMEQTVDLTAILASLKELKLSHDKEIVGEPDA